MSPPTRPFTPAWLADDPVALGFLPGGHRHPDARAAAVARASSRRIHPAVLDALVATTPAQEQNRDALGRPGTTAVVTGQQAGLFGGPLYTIYKAAAAIADARALAKETGTPCVPVFWLQNEDHDFAEIASCSVLGTDGALHTLAVPDDPADRDRSIAARRLGPAVTTALDTVADLLDGLPDADATLDLLRQSYTPDRSPDAAFRAWIETLFAPHGLLVVDPWVLQGAALPVHHRAIEDAARIATTLGERSQALTDAGFPVQVHVRPGSPLCFVHPDGPSGPRRRFDGLPPDGATFSTSALLRPILQDSWLPTVAYVGGPGEIAYFAQLPPLYAAFDLPTPLVVPRARFRVIDDASRRLLDHLGIDADALSAPRETLLGRLVRPTGDHPDPVALEAALLDPLRAALAAFGPHADALDPGLARATAKTTGTVVEAVTRLVERYRRTLAQGDTVTTDRLDRLRVRLQPDGAPQERVHAWPWFAARYGVRGFVDTVLDAVVPFDGALRDLRP